MKFLPLLWAGLWRKRARTIFTLLSIVTAFLLFGMLQGVLSAFDKSLEQAAVDRLTVVSKVSFTEPLPYSYLSQIETIPGVVGVTYASWFGAYFQDPKNVVFSFPIDPERYFSIVPEANVTPEQQQAMMRTRTGALIGVDLAKKYGWKVGDRVPLHSVIWTKTSGGSDWDFDIVGIFTSASSQFNGTFYLNHSYFDEGRSFGRGTVGWYVVRLKDPNAANQVAQTIDTRFANSHDETKTQTEKEFQQSFIKQQFDIVLIVRLILLAVFFTLLFLTGNTMMQSVRERIPELAVLKTLGFTDTGVQLLVLGESLLLCLFAAAIGLGLSAAIFPGLKDFIGTASLPGQVLIIGAVIATLLALITGLLPALRAKRLNIIDALAGTLKRYGVNTTKQIGAVISISLSTLPQRIGTSLVIVIGIAGVVAVLLSVLAMATGFQKTLSSTGREDRALVLRGGSDSELASTISRENTLTILDAPGVKRNAEGKPVGSAEAMVIVDLPKKSNDAASNVTMRGVGSQGMVVRPEIHVVEGRMYSPGLRELIVGRGAQHQFKGLGIGQKIELRGSDWTIVGAFESNGDSHESELIADGETVLSAYRRNLYQSVFVQLESAAAFEIFKKALTSDPQLAVEVKREREYYAEQSKALSKVLSFVAYVVGGIMAVGALFGALNTMYSAVSTRSQEIATLRAIGFGNTPVVLSIMFEALLLALIGALIGSALSWFFFNGNAISTLGANFTQVVFKLTVTPQLIVLGIVWACVIGVIGGLFPAIRAARLPVATALRAS